MQATQVPDFDALKRTFEAGSTNANGGSSLPTTTSNGASTNGVGGGVGSYHDAAYPVGAAGFSPSNGGLYPGGPFVPAQTSQQPSLNGNLQAGSSNGASTSNGVPPPPGQGLPPNGAFSPVPTSPFLSGANSPNNGGALSGFGSPSSLPGGLPLPAGNPMNHGTFSLPTLSVIVTDFCLSKLDFRCTQVLSLILMASEEWLPCLHLWE